ncbi:MAG: hypothetical protein J5478_03915 [Bacteroidales bacterium]|nr:hypothetical protein [Bacteroidales bacterium]
MKNRLKYSVLAALCVALSFLSGCTSQLDTDQFVDKGISLAALAPNPVMRGGELRIVGSNLENVKEVQFAGGVTVTSIQTVTTGRKSEIRVMVPAEGPEVGPVTLVAQDGQKTSSLADLTFTEPISIDSVTPEVALSGDVVTVKGDYLNTVQEVILGGDIYVTEFVAQSRHELQFELPCAAVTGYVIVSDVNELLDENTIPNKIYSPEELTVGDPTVKKNEFAIIKAGDEVSVKGEHLDMIQRVTLPGVTDWVVFMVSLDATELVFWLPAEAGDGEIVLTSFGGKEFVAGEMETVFISDVAVASLAEDGRYKAGTSVEITGEDLDLVMNVAFKGADAEWYFQDGKIIATIPAEAQDGSINLRLGSGKEYWSDPIEVVKPEVMWWTITKPVVAGQSDVEFVGNDLDLVTKAWMGTKEKGIVECTFDFGVTEAGHQAVYVHVPSNAYTSQVFIASAAGYEDGTEDSIEVTYDEVVSVSFTLPEYGMGNPISITGKNLLKVDRVYIKGKRVTDFGVRADDAMTFGLPEGIGPGVYRLDFVLMDNTELTWPVPFEVTAPYTETHIWDGYEDLGSWSNQPYLGPDGGFADAGLAIGDIVRIYYTPLADWWQYQIFGGHWEGMTFPELGGGNTVSKDNTEPGAQYFAFEVTDENYGILTGVGGWGGALLTQGEGVAITSLTMVHFGAAEKRTTIWEGSVTVGGWDGSMGALSWGGYDWSTVQAGTKLAVSFTANADDAVMRFGNGSWASLPSLAGLATDGNIPIAGLNSYVFELTDSDLDQLVNAGGLVICGAYWTLTEVALVTMEGGGRVETDIWEGDIELSNWTNYDALGSETLFLDAGLQPGMEVRFYTSGGAAEWMIQLFDGHWGGMTFAETGGTNQFNNENTDLSKGYFSFVATEAHVAQLTSLQDWGSFIILQGDGGVHVTKIVIL